MRSDDDSFKIIIFLDTFLLIGQKINLDIIVKSIIVCKSINSFNSYSLLSIVHNIVYVIEINFDQQVHITIGYKYVTIYKRTRNNLIGNLLI